MNKSRVFMFSGQGSQYYNMGRNLYLSNPVFHRWMEKLDNIFASLTGKSVIKILYDGNRQKSEPFDNILYTHPAIFMLEYSLAQVLLERGIYPDYVLGASLGEYTACAVAGVISCEYAVRCLVTQAKMLESHCLKGGMLAIINDYRLYDDMPVLSKNSELVSVNYHSHFIVSGSINNLKEIEEYLKVERILFQRLPVSFAFHSRLIDPIASVYNCFLKSITLKSPEVNFISSLTGDKNIAFDSSYFWDVVRKPINFRSAVRNLRNEQEYVFIDLGPSGTLVNFVKYNLDNENQASIFPIITPFNNETRNLERLYESFI